MIKLTGEELKKNCLSLFPEFKESNEYKIDLDPESGPYEFFARFSDFFLRKIDEEGESGIVIKIFDFINNIHNREDLSSEVWDLIGIELLENLEAEDKYKKLANKYLKGKALNAFLTQEGRPEE